MVDSPGKGRVSGPIPNRYQSGGLTFLFLFFLFPSSSSSSPKTLFTGFFPFELLGTAAGGANATDSLGEAPPVGSEVDAVASISICV